MMVCYLCRSSASLLQSHVIPNFAVRQARNQTYAQQFIKSVGGKIILVQQAYKQPLLCGACEKKFSGWESQFASQLYHPMLAASKSNVVYDSWLHKFATSIAWRIGRIFLDKQKVLLSANNRNKISTALSIWRLYLLGRAQDYGPYQHSLFLYNDADVLTFMNAFSAKYNATFNQSFLPWMMGHIDFSVSNGTSGLYLYGKMPGAVFLTAIEPSKLKTRPAILQSGTWQLQTSSVDFEMIAFCMNACNKTVNELKSALTPAMSSRLNQKLSTAVKKDYSIFIPSKRLINQAVITNMP